jgi:hypothetical protein
MEQLGEWLTRLGLLWLDGFIVILVAAIQAGPFLLAGGGITVFTLLFLEREPQRRHKKRRDLAQETDTAARERRFTLR